MLTRYDYGLLTAYGVLGVADTLLTWVGYLYAPGFREINPLAAPMWQAGAVMLAAALKAGAMLLLAYGLHACKSYRPAYVGLYTLSTLIVGVTALAVAIGGYAAISLDYSNPVPRPVWTGPYEPGLPVSATIRGKV